ncbi:hypothetical protein ACERK3_15585 [Phycisphaerales bacterium AB-hyl4]|uniref:Helix-turn-helix domain-containing protein n=1 Tax=Natronomicrosphaera hydrolytica TaxID=3242702 RepID=A0ABV4UAT1_9BACT
MSRRLTQPYRCASLSDLARQLAFAPPNRRIEQVRRAERLHDELAPQRTYPLDFIIYRLTGYRPETRADNDSLLLVGEAIQPDLRLIIDQLSRSVDMPADDNDPCETVDQLADRLNVNPRTIARWRKLGLRWRWMPRPQADRKQIVIPRAALDHFQQDHDHRIERAAAFTQIDPDARQAIITRARRLAEARDVSFNQVATHLARRTGRALETIRLILDKHDRAQPDNPIFTDRTGPLTPRQRRVIARAYRMNVPVRKLTRRFHRTRATIYRAIHQQRAAELRRLHFDYVASPIFDREDADAVILRRPTADTPPSHAEAKHIAAPTALAPNLADLPAALHADFTNPSLATADVRSLLIRYNYLKYKACRIRDALHRHEPRGRDLDAFDHCLANARDIRSTLLRAHRPLLLSVARRHLISETEPPAARLIELLEQGHPVLSDAIEQFSIARSVNFDSYLTNRLLRSFAAGRTDLPRARRRRSADDLAAHLLHLIRSADAWPAANEGANAQ